MSDNLPALLASVRALTTSIRNIVSTKLGKTEIAADTALLEGKTFAQHAASSQGLSGELLFIDKDNVSMSYDPASLVTELRKAPSDAEITRMKNAPWLMADVFNKWKRISHEASGVFPAFPGELTGWSYDVPTDAVRSTINSNSLIGLISPDVFDEYTFEVVCSSIGPDDDGIGLVLAFKSVGGVEHTLTVMISTGGLATYGGSSSTLQPGVFIGINAMQTPAQGKQLLFTKTFGTARGNYNIPLYAEGFRIKAVRTAAGMITVQVTQPDGTDWPNGEIKWTGALPDLFKTPCPVGYFSISQAGTTYKNLVVPSPKSDIIDTRDQNIHRWNNTTQTWGIAGKASAVLAKGRLYKNTETPMDTSFLTLDGDFVSVGAPGSPTYVTPVSELTTLAAGATKQYDLQTLLGATYATFDIKGAAVTAMVKDTNPASPLYNAYANAEGLIVYGIKDNRYVVVANQSGASIDLYVKVLVHPSVI